MPRQRQVLAKRTRAQRRQERQALGRLKSQVVSPKTEERYLTSVSRFLEFLIAHGKPYPQSFLILDREVSLFIEELWEQGDPKGWAGDCLSGLGHFIPSCKPYLVGAWRLHAAWGRAELPCRAPPFTPCYCMLLRKRLLTMAGSIWLSFSFWAFTHLRVQGSSCRQRLGILCWEKNRELGLFPCLNVVNVKGSRRAFS